jgi:hypothetical protein
LNVAVKTEIILKNVSRGKVKEVQVKDGDLVGLKVPISKTKKQQTLQQSGTHIKDLLTVLNKIKSGTGHNPNIKKIKGGNDE